MCSPPPLFPPGIEPWAGLVVREGPPAPGGVEEAGSWFMCLFEVKPMVNMAAVPLKLPASMRVQPTFHVLWVKPVGESPEVDTPSRFGLSMAHPPTRSNRSWKSTGGAAASVEWEDYSSEERSWVPC